MKRAGAIVFLALLLTFGGWLFNQCYVNQRINFLTPGPGAWIIYPTPRRATPLPGNKMTTVFRRDFVWPQNLPSATLTWRCFKAGELSLNGVNIATNDPAHWKKNMRVDAARYLHPGTNEMAIRVSCNDGLPALSLELEGDGAGLKSDETWECSLAGAIWQPAQTASQPVAPLPGHWLYRNESLQGAFQMCWPVLFLFAVVAAAAVAAQRRWSGFLPARAELVGFILLGGAWALLFVHNLPLLPAMIGFDASAHLAYIDFIQQHKSLPTADLGWEFFQAPLYYIMGAIVLGVFHMRALQPEAGQVLGVMNLLLGAVELALILFALRQLFPGRRPLQLAGLLLAAFLPAQVCLLHYPTNEILGAVVATAALCVCLTMLRRENPGVKWYAALGAILGLALLSKASAVVTVAAVFAALTAKVCMGRQSAADFLRRGTLCLALCLVIGGWHYWRLWRQFGNPLIGNWDPAVGPAWWQQPGFRTPAYYLTFGESLVRPLFSGFHSFWDSLFSTWWGDGLIGGASLFYGRPAWNYHLMTVGYVLALIPSVLVLTGLWRALRDGFRQRRMDFLFLTAVALLFAFAIFSMSLKLPSYSQAKALYALPAMLPFCVFGVLGLEFWLARFPRGRAVILVCLGVWLLNVYASFWILPNTVPTLLSKAVALYDVPGQDPGPAFAKVLALDPQNPEAIVALAGLDKDGGHISRAVARLETAAQTATNQIIDTALALHLGEQGNVAEALVWAGRACDLGVDFPSAPALACSLSLRAGHNEQAAQAGRLALRLKPQDDEIQFNVGLALTRLKHYAEAATYFSNALDAAPANADAHFWLGIVLWNLPGKKAEAREQIATAVRLSPQNAKWKSTLEEMKRE